MAATSHDPNLGAGPSEDSEISLNQSDSGSLLSDDSVFPDYIREEKDAGTATTLLEACARNEDCTLQTILGRGVTKEEVMELDINGRNGLMLAVSRGFVDIISGLHTCPFIDINLQDYDGNTALMIAAQAGFITILNYILNYYPGVDTELRDPRGFTAVIKAGLQGRDECVSALLMHGADLHALDSGRGRNLKDWCLRTGRYETLHRLRSLQAHPIAEQFCDTYIPEWPELKQLVAKATATKTFRQKLTQCLKDRFTFSFQQDPQDNGAIDHMVRITTSIHSPLVSTGCRPLCPASPPEVGKRRLAVPELVAQHSDKELEETCVSHRSRSVTSATPSTASTLSVSAVKASGVGRFIPRSLSRRNCVFPAGCIPKIEVTRSTEPTPKKEPKWKIQKGYLEPPIWKYKEIRSDRKKEKKRTEKLKEEQEQKVKDEREKKVQEEQERKAKEERRKKRKARHKK